MPVYRSGSSYSDTRSGTDNAALAHALRALTVGNRRRIAGRLLDPAGEPAPIGAERASASRDVGGDASGGGAGIVSPLAEQPYEGAEYHQLISSDGLFVFEYPAQTTYLDDDGEGVEIVVKHLAP